MFVVKMLSAAHSQLTDFDLLVPTKLLPPLNRSCVRKKCENVNRCTLRSKAQIVRASILFMWTFSLFHFVFIQSRRDTLMLMCVCVFVVVAVDFELCRSCFFSLHFVFSLHSTRFVSANIGPIEILSRFFNLYLYTNSVLNSFKHRCWCWLMLCYTFFSRFIVVAVCGGRM